MEKKKDHQLAFIEALGLYRVELDPARRRGLMKIVERHPNRRSDFLWRALFEEEWALVESHGKSAQINLAFFLLNEEERALCLDFKKLFRLYVFLVDNSRQMKHGSVFSSMKKTMGLLNKAFGKLTYSEKIKMLRELVQSLESKQNPRSILPFFIHFLPDVEPQSELCDMIHEIMHHYDHSVHNFISSADLVGYLDKLEAVQPYQQTHAVAARLQSESVA